MTSPLSRLSRLFSRKVSAKILAGYLVILALMLIFGLNTIIQLDKIGKTLKDLNNRLETEKDLAHNIAVDLSLARLYTKQYVSNPTQSNLDLSNEHFTRLEGLLSQVDQLVVEPDRRQALKEIQADIKDYGERFEQIVALTQANVTIQTSVLDAQSVIVDNQITALRIHINLLNDPKVFLAFGNAQAAYQAMRINVLRYQKQDNALYTVLIDRHYREATKAFVNLEDDLDDPTRVQDAEQAIEALEKYNQGVQTIIRNQDSLQDISSEQNEVLEPRIIQAVNDVSAAIDREFEERNLKSQALILQTRLALLAATLLIVGFSLVFGAVLSYRITRPLEQVMQTSQQIANTDLAALSRQMNALTQGDIQIDLSISAEPLQVTLQDEVGQMAAAFNEIIYRLHDAEKAFKEMAAYLSEMAGTAQAIAEGDLGVQIVRRSEQDVLGNALVGMVSNLRIARQQLLAQVNRLEILRKVDEMITTSQDLPGTLQFLLEQAVQLLQVDAAEIRTFQGEAGDLVQIAGVHAPAVLDPEWQVRLAGPVRDEIMRTRQSVSLDDLDGSGLVTSQEDRLQGSFALPLFAKDELRGLMMVYTENQAKIKIGEINFLEMLARQAAIAIENDELVRGLEERVAARTLELRYSQRYFESLLMNNPVAIVVVDLKGMITTWNPAAVRLFGYQPEEVIGKVLDEILAPDELHEEARRLTSLGLSQDNAFQAFVRRARKDGSQVDVSVMGVPIRVDGEVLGSLAIYHDISELQRARQTAEDNTRTKSEFLANMSHEIRTPMNGVVGMTSLLLDTQLSPKQRDYVETIRLSAEVLLTIINDILDFSKIEAGKMDLEQQPFSLRDCVESTLDLVSHQAAAKHLEIGYLMAPSIPEWIYGDATRLRQILVNLLSNAVKFTESGEVIVTIQPANHLAGGGSSWSKTGDSIGVLHFSVRDTGIGIPPERMERLFRSFSQVDSSTTRKYGGTGLGLAISKRLVEMMGGTMWVESEGIAGKGTTFHFQIQVKKAPDLPGVDRNVALLNLNGKRVFVVDDNATNRKIVVHMTQSWGIEAREFQSGPELLEAIDAGETADLAILDMQMPEMDGVTLTNQLHQRPASQQLPVMIVTSLNQREEPGLAGEIASFLQKPIKSSQLYDALVLVFSNHPVYVEPASKEEIFDEQMAKRHPLRILLAEDHVVNQKVALLTLERLGYRADVASNGLEVIQAFQRQAYDVVLMDVQMPEMDGLEATQHLRENLPANQQPWILAVTANAVEGDRERYLAEGMDDYLSKPVHIDELVKKLEQVRPNLIFAGEDIHPATPSSAEGLSPVISEAEGSQAIDLNVLEDYFPDVDQDRATFNGVAEMFLLDSPGRLEKLQQAIASPDARQVKNIAHSMKSASLYFGAVQLSGLCKTLELAGDAGDLEDAARQFDQIRREYQRVAACLKGLIGTEGP